MSRIALPAYGTLGFALAFSALAIHMLIPSYYSSQVGLSLQTVGIILFVTRLLDACQDPWLGRAADWVWQRGKMKIVLSAASGLLLLGFALLWSPGPAGPNTALWLSLALVLTYVGHSFVNITYLTWGGRLPGGVRQLTAAAAWREGAGLVGVICAALVPQLAGTHPGASLIAVFAATLLLGLWLLLAQAPRPAWQKSTHKAHWALAWQSPRLRNILLAFLLSNLGSAVAATLALFFIADRLGAAAYAGPLLAAYFVAAACGLPLWAKLAGRFGPRATWRLGLVLNCVVFVWALLLGHGDVLPYLVICLLAGATLGADLALPTVLLAQALPNHEPPGSWFGIWALLTKLALALAGLALPLLAWLGYQPGLAGGEGALTLVYAGLPCVLKLAAAALLHRPHGDAVTTFAINPALQEPAP